MRTIYRANTCKNREKYLEEFLDSFELLKLEVRLCSDLKLFSIKQHARIALSMDRIGKQITGWLNSTKKIPKSVFGAHLTSKKDLFATY